MKTSDLLPWIYAARKEVSAHLGPQALEAIAELEAALKRFADRPIGEFITKVQSVKPARQRPRPALVTADVVQRYVEQVRSAFGDSRSVAEIMGRVRSDKSVRKAEAIAIARELGVKTNSKTGKEQALGGIESLSAEAQRDRAAAERIRRGA